MSGEKNVSSKWIDLADRDPHRRFFHVMILIRWVIIVFLLLNFYCSYRFADFQLRPVLFIAVGIYALFNGLLALVEKRGAAVTGLCLLVDLALVSLLIYFRGGLRSDLFLLYYFFLIFWAFAFGVRGIITGTLLVSIVYAGICLFATKITGIDYIIYSVIKRMLYFAPVLIFVVMILRQYEDLSRNKVEMESLFAEIKVLNDKLMKSEEDKIEELALAKKVIDSIVCPRKEFTLENVSVHVGMRSAGELGGDFYGVLPDCPVKGTLTVFVGDVVGRGTSAALLTISMMILMKEASTHFYSPREVLTYLNRVMLNSLEPEFFNTSVFLMHLEVETRILTFSRAGHESGFLYCSKENSCREITTRGMLLGIKPEVRYFDESIELGAGDKVILYTDGLVDARDAQGEFWSRDRLRGIIQENGGSPGGEVIEGIFREVTAFSRDVEDDQAVIVVSV